MYRPGKPAPPRKDVSRVLEVELKGSPLRLLFATTLFVSAFLLFSIQPMMAKFIMPAWGGSPAVWNTCMVFFQAALLAGYAYTHITTAWLGVRRQAAIHSALLLLPILALPLMLVTDAVVAPPTGHPTFWLVRLLAISVGLPFFVVATSAPLLQSWFSRTADPAARDPYFLYGASNLGSILALIAYPLWLEPHLRLSQQGRAWSLGYGLLAVLTFSCMAAARGASTTTPAPSADPPEENGARPCPNVVDKPITMARRLSWVALAALPSSLMLGVTTYLTTDIAPIPLIWVVPLAIYLLTFILAFARRTILPHSWMVRILPAAIALATYTYQLGPLQLFCIPIHLFAFFVTALVAHGALARDRPSPRHLTAFYFWVSLGGVLGGLFNALVAPVAFDRIVEYPLILVLACLLGPGSRAGKRPPRRWLDVATPLLFGGLASAILLALPAYDRDPWGTEFQWLIGSLIVLCLICANRPIRLAAGLGSILLAGGLASDKHGRILVRERDFFGVLRVVHDTLGGYHLLMHGSTIHGQQSLDPSRRQEPLNYYHRTGPFGHIYKMFRRGSSRPSVAVVGLGAGTLASYAEPHQRWVFYEIDPAVERIARDPRYFTFLKDSRAGRLDVVLGDARLRLREAPDHQYGLIVLDAFNSDAIPLHLFTREALRIYLEKLSDNGAIAFHISNKFFDFQSVLSNLARDAGLVCLVCFDVRPADGSGRLPSFWAVMGRRRADLGGLVYDRRWRPISTKDRGALWTDDYSDPIRILVR